MTTIINADNVTGGAIITGDTSGILALQSAGSTLVTLSGGTVAISAGLTADSASFTGGIAGASATITGAISGGSASITGAITAGLATITGAVSAGSASITNTLTLGGTAVTATAAELNTLDGITATTAELNILDGVTATAAELNILDGVTADANELNILDGITATTAELNYNDITTLGTSEASKVVTADANGDVNLSEELKAKSYNETYVALSGTTPAVDCEAGNMFALTTSGNTTFTFSNPPTTGTAYGFSLKLTAGGTHTIAYPASVDWAGATAPDAPASGETDVLVFITHDGGTTWYGALSIDAAG